MAKALDVAAYIVRYCYDNNTPISNLQLQKILYFVWIDYYKEKRIRLFEDFFYAWSLGPVVIPVYNKYCTYGGMRIRPLDESTSFFGQQSEEDEFNNILKRYCTVSAYDLVEKSHIKDGAWATIYDEGKGSGQVIPFDLIEEKLR